MSDTFSKHHPFSFIFNWGNREITGGQVWRVGRMGNDNHDVVSHKLCGFQGSVGGHVLLMEPVVVMPEFRFFSSQIFSQASQNVTVKVELIIVLGGTNSQRTIPITLKKTISMLFVELQTCHAFFALGDCGLLHCNNCCFVSGS
jgi:hypothetical protein